MELQIPCGICTEISPKSIFRRTSVGNWSNSSGIMQMEGHKYHRGICVSGSCAYAIKEYIANQLKEDPLNGQLTMEDVDPFTGSK